MDENGKETAHIQDVTESGVNLVMPEDSKRGKITGYLILTTVTCFAGSSFQFGYNLGVVNAPSAIIKQFFSGVENFDKWIWPSAVALFSIGGMFGALGGPHVAKSIGSNKPCASSIEFIVQAIVLVNGKYSRKKTLMGNNIFAIIGGVLLLVTKEANSVSLLVIGRFLVGVNAGCNTVVAPMYLSEVAPIHLRGALGTLNQFGIVSGILVSQVLGLDKVIGTEKGWPFLFGMTAFIGFIQLCILPFCPESPRYLYISKGMLKEAEQVLVTLRGVSDVSEYLNEMQTEKDSSSAEKPVSLIGLFREPRLRRPLIISVVLQLSQQLSGINGVFNYSTDLFKKVLSPEQSQAATTGIGVISVIMTAIVVKLVEVAGRRTLMLWGLGGMVVSYTAATIAFVLVEEGFNAARYVAVALTLVLIVFFQLGPGPIPWFIVAELFSQGPLPAAISVSGIVNWMAGFAVSFLFTAIEQGIHPYTFCPFIVLVALFWLFTKFYVPETKGKTINEIKNIFEEQRNFGAMKETCGNSEKIGNLPDAEP